MKIKIGMISDLHGNLNFELPKCDILLVAGDFIDASYRQHDYNYRYCKNKFDAVIAWLNKAPADHVVCVPGNHDGMYQELNMGPQKLGKVEILVDSFSELPIKIYGFPWTPVFGDWAYYLPNDFMEHKVMEIPRSTQILLTHGPAYNILDVVRNEHVGCKALMNRLPDLQKLKLHTFGHIHEGYGMKEVGEYAAVNAALSDYWGHIVKKPVVLDLDIDVKEENNTAISKIPVVPMVAVEFPVGSLTNPFNRE